MKLNDYLSEHQTSTAFQSEGISQTFLFIVAIFGFLSITKITESARPEFCFTWYIYFEFEYLSFAIVTAGIVPNGITPSKFSRCKENLRNFNKHGAENWTEWTTNRQRADVQILNSYFTVICVSKMTWGRCLLMSRTFDSQMAKKLRSRSVVNHMFSDFLHNHN